MKTLTFDEKYGDIREDGLTVIQEQKGAGWPELAREIVECVNQKRFIYSNACKSVADVLAAMPAFESKG